MGCFSCFRSRKVVRCEEDHQVNVSQTRDMISSTPAYAYNGDKQGPVLADANSKAEAYTGEINGNNSAIAFTFRELAIATKNFRQECLIGEGGVGRVFKGTLQSSGQIVAVRQLDRSGTQGSKEFQVEVLTLSLLSHPNLVKMIGYCADGEQRLLVYEYMPSGSLRNRLFGNRRPLDWSTRVNIALAIAQGLEYLHEKANPPIIYRDLKSSSILLDEANNPRLSEYGLAKLFQSGNKMHVSAYGYCAPEYERHGELTLKSDVYSFGVVLLELITGRRAFDSERPTVEQNLVCWAQQFFRDPKRFPDMADPLLERQFPITSLNQVVGVASMCLHEEPSVRPFISDVVAALSFLAMAPPEAPVPDRLAPMLSSRVAVASQDTYNYAEEDGQRHGENQGEDHEYNFDKQNERDFKYDEDSASSDDEDSQSGRKRYHESSNS